MNAIPGGARPVLARGVRLRRDNVAGTYLLLRPERGFELRGGALEVVRAFEAGPTVDGLIDELAGRYAGDRAEIAADVHRLLGELVARGLVELEGWQDDDTDAPACSPGGVGGAPRPYTLVAELTYRCPLRCAYCSNPVRLDAIGPELTAPD